MAEFWKELVHNPMMVSAALAWLTAQVIKTVLVLVMERRFVPERLFGSGGMPSAHSATVCALVTAVGFVYGGSGAAFPLAFFFAFIVMYDARGVRRETGEQAKLLNELLQEWKESGRKVESRDPMDQFKELVGHTPLQVFIGALLGIAVAVAVHFGFYAG